MNCRNCGAAMELLRSGAGFACAYCQTRNVLASGENCNIPGELRWLGPSADNPACPACDEALQDALLDRHLVQGCRGCGGVLLSRDTFAQLVRLRRMAYAGADATPAPIEPRDLSRRARCPGCRKAMETHPYYGPGAVVVDSCSDCALVWLDCGELSQIEKAPGARRW